MIIMYVTCWELCGLWVKARIKYFSFFTKIRYSVIADQWGQCKWKIFVGKKTTCYWRRNLWHLSMLSRFSLRLFYVLHSFNDSVIVLSLPTAWVFMSCFSTFCKLCCFFQRRNHFSSRSFCLFIIHFCF